MYCRTDGESVCTACFLTHHKGHDLASLEEEFQLVAAKTEAAVAGLQKMKEERSQKTAELEESVKEAREQKENSKQCLKEMRLS